MGNFEKIDTSKDVTDDELQAYINSAELDLPDARRDLSKPENVRWLLRNLFVRNEVPMKYRQALAALSRKI